MKQYIVIEKPLFLLEGILELTEKQYQTRKPFLKPLKKKDQYEVIGSVCFKLGEKIGYNGKVGKVIHRNLVSPEDYAKGADAGKSEVDFEKTVEDLKAKLGAKDKELATMDKELVEIKEKLEKMVKINQEFLKQKEKPDFA